MAPTHSYTVTLSRTIEQHATLDVLADSLDEAIRLALMKAKTDKYDLPWRHHAVAATIHAPADLVLDHGEPDPVLPFRGPGVL